MSQAMNMMTDMAMQSARHSNMDAERSRLNNISNSNDQALKEKELRKAAEGFEAIFIQKMWDEMRSSLPKNGLHYSKEEEYWQSMYSQELGKSMASSGGIGLADMMVEQLTRPCPSAPQSGALSRIRMAVEPAPLIPKKAENTQNTQQAQNNQANQAQPNQAQANQVPQIQQASTPAINTALMYEAYNQQQEETNSQSQEQNHVENQQASQQIAEQQAQQAPQYVRTTYITNLPPEERKHAILDRNGEPVRKTQHAHRAERPERTRQAGQTQNTADMASSRSFNASQTAQTAEVQNRLENSVLVASNDIPTTAHAALAVNNEPTDILSGITTTYIPFAQRMEMIMASQRATQLAQAEQAQTQILVAENQNTEQNQDINPVQTNASINRAPSLEQALRIGTLVASLNPEEINHVQMRQMFLAENISVNSNAPASNVIGGGTILTSPLEQANRPEFVSALAPQNDFAMPVNGSISSGFGWRMDPISSKRAWHTGVDIRANAGASVTASGSGVVRFAGQDEELGNMVIIDHGNGIESVYGHNAELLVKTGDTINTGTQIARVGASGRANGSHLHFEIRQNGLSINPEPYFTNNGNEMTASQTTSMV